MSSTDARARPVSAADRRRPKEFPVAIGPASYLRVVAEICRLGSKDHVLPTYLIDVRNPQDAPPPWSVGPHNMSL
jgi:hypothetical protein